VGVGDGEEVVVAVDPIGGGGEDAAPLDAHAVGVVVQVVDDEVVVVFVQFPVPGADHRRVLAGQKRAHAVLQRGAGGEDPPVAVGIVAFGGRQRGTTHVHLEAGSGRAPHEVRGEGARVWRRPHVHVGVGVDGVHVRRVCVGHIGRVGVRGVGDIGG